MRNAIHSLLLVVTLCLVILAANTPAAGQRKQQPAPSPTPEKQEQDKIIIPIRRVRLPISVLDKKGQPVAGLTKNDFLILEDKQPQQIEDFADERSESLPLYIGVLMDTSPSTAAKLKFEQESAKDFMYTMVRLRKDFIAFATFDHEIKLRQDFTNKLDLLDRAVDKAKELGKQTALYDAIWQFCDEKMRSAPGRRVLLVITDGDDTYSRATLRDAIDIAQRTETVIFAISTKAGFSGAVPGVEAGQVSDSGDKDLQRLCEETGGRAFFTGDRLALEKSLTTAAKEMHAQYFITYRPTNDRYDGQYRRIEVKLANNRDGLKVRTRRGYTAVADNVATVPR